MFFFPFLENISKRFKNDDDGKSESGDKDDDGDEDDDDDEEDEEDLKKYDLFDSESDSEKTQPVQKKTSERHNSRSQRSRSK